MHAKKLFHSCNTPSLVKSSKRKQQKVDKTKNTETSDVEVLHTEQNMAVA